MSDPIVFGAAYSVYVRFVRLALEEKGTPYRLEEIDVFAPDGPPAGYYERHPFGRIPAFEHDGFRLYESGAISRYVDEAFIGPRLQPSAPKARARMNQIISVLDNYAYRTLVWEIFVERVRVPARGRTPDEQKIASALPVAERCLSALEALMNGEAYLVGEELTLADLHAAPVFAYFRMAPEGTTMLRRYAGLQGWWDRMVKRESLAKACPPLGN
jgi:glutathione S-transferase